MNLNLNKQILIIVNKYGQGGTFNAALNFSIGYQKLGYKNQILFLKTKKVRNDLKQILKKKQINLLHVKDLNKIKKPDFIHIIGHGIHLPLIKKISKKFPDSKIYESNIFGKKNSYEYLLEESWQLNNWCNFNYILSGGKKNYNYLPLPVNYDFLLEYKKKYSKHKIKRNRLSILKISQDANGKWSKNLINIFSKIYLKNNKATLTLVTPPKEIKFQIKKLPSNIKKQISIINKIYSYEQLYRLYSISNTFLHLTQQGETFGYVLFEANFFDCKMICNETPWADNSQVEILRDLYNQNHSYNNNYSIIRSITESIKFNQNKKYFLKKNLNKYSHINVCKNAIKIMTNNGNYTKTKNYNLKTLINLIINPNKDLVTFSKNLFLKIIVIIFSIYSFKILKKLRRVNII